MGRLIPRPRPIKANEDIFSHRGVCGIITNQNSKKIVENCRNCGGNIIVNNECSYCGTKY